MSYLNTNLKIFKFDDGDDHWVIAKNKEDAINWFENEYADKEMLLSNINSNENICDAYEVKEISIDDDTCINCREDIDLIGIMNRYKVIKIDDPKEQYYYVPIWTYLKYWIIECELQEREFEVPNLLARDRKSVV